MNTFPPKGGASNYYALIMVVTGRTLDYKKYCKYTFRSYVQALYKSNPTNTTNPRTIGCIHLQTRYAEHTVHELMNLNTGKIISCRRITEIPATEEVMARVEELAKRDKMQPDLIFKSQKGIIAEAENTEVSGLLDTAP